MRRTCAPLNGLPSNISTMIEYCIFLWSSLQIFFWLSGWSILEYETDLKQNIFGIFYRLKCCTTYYKICQISCQNLQSEWHKPDLKHNFRIYLTKSKFFWSSWGKLQKKNLLVARPLRGGGDKGRANKKKELFWSLKTQKKCCFSDVNLLIWLQWFWH